MICNVMFSEHWISYIKSFSACSRDLVDLICNSLERYHFCQAKIGKEKFVNLPSERRDAELKMTLIAENKLHPALFSANAEYKVRLCGW